jgi:hypothetical protein
MTDPTARIEAALTHLGSEHEPPAGWEARVIAATTVPQRKPWWLFAASALACAVGVAAVVGPRGWAAQDSALGVDINDVTSGRLVRSSGSHNVGDVVHLVAHGGGGYRAVWVYRHDQLVAACPGAAACSVARDATSLDLLVRAPGNYQVVGLSSVVPVVPLGARDGDVANAQTAGASVAPKPFTVR